MGCLLYRCHQHNREIFYRYTHAHAQTHTNKFYVTRTTTKSRKGKEEKGSQEHNKAESRWIWSLSEETAEQTLHLQNRLDQCDVVVWSLSKLPTFWFWYLGEFLIFSFFCLMRPRIFISFYILRLWSVHRKSRREGRREVWTEHVHAHMYFNLMYVVSLDQA